MLSNLNPEKVSELTRVLIQSLFSTIPLTGSQRDATKSTISSTAAGHAVNQIGLTPEEVISKIMANPDVALAFQNPRIQAAIMDCSQNPLSIAKYQMTRR
ncbi:Protein TIC 40, chloroplastic [Vitis vinifera]|uniref:Protein TIC 40, chloroplastic n=1 Tax=Vitis vinifera TaxID=29760 RepID=A0A438IDW3_VITVI|nr:Protein TIC 40, chloroplastic [Vitis vinifera]